MFATDRDLTIIATSGTCDLQGGLIGKASLRCDSLTRNLVLNTGNCTARTGSDSDAEIVTTSGNITLTCNTLTLDHGSVDVPTTTATCQIGGPTTTGNITITTANLTDLTMTGGTPVNRACLIETTGNATLTVGRDLKLACLGGTLSRARIKCNVANNHSHKGYHPDRKPQCESRS